MKLQNLQIDAFRGASKLLTIDFDADKRITMIFGENGNGKSTITDSLVCLCTDEHGSLDDKSSIDKSFYTSISRQLQDVKVVLSTSAGKFQASLSAAKAFVKNPTSGLPLVRHLRRSQITQFIEAQPNKRYEHIHDFIDVGNVFKCEDTLRKLQRDTQGEQDIAISTLTSVSNTLEQTWIKEGRRLANWESWAKQESEKDIAEEEKKYRNFQEITGKWKSIAETKVKLASDKAALKTAIESKEAAESKIKEAQEVDEGANTDLLSLLQSAKTFISGNEKIESCPVCDGSVDRNVLIGSLSGKIDSMKAFNDLVSAVDAAGKAVTTKQGIVNATIDSLIKKIEGLEESISKFPDEPFTTLTTKLVFIKSADENEKKLGDFTAAFSDLEKEFDSLSKQAEGIKTAIDQHNLIKGQYKSILDARKKSENTEKVLDAIKKSLVVVETARKDFVQAELDSISSEVDALYQKIHPNENLGGVSLTLKKNVKQSLELSADFHGKTGITPQSAYSESHLDTMGICVFLALAKKYGSKNSILILDDVVMSVDETHLDRFIELLHDEADGIAHIIITTHYRPWRDRYRNNRAPQGKVHFVELGRWSLANGIRIQNSKVALDELRHALNDPSGFDRQKTASIAGIILENALDFLTVLFESRVPRKPKNDYQLRELLDSFSKKLMLVLKVEYMEKDAATGKYSTATIIKTVELKDLLNNIKQLTAVRNQVGAHYNFDGSLVSDNDVEEFGKLALELVELIICPDLVTSLTRTNPALIGKRKAVLSAYIL